MPNRIIKESICTSEKVNSLSDFHFRLWACLITYVDDYGRGDARSAIIKGRCFPLRERVTVKDIDAGLHVLADTGCILLYEVDGGSYLCFPNWDKHQTVRNKKSKYPAPKAGSIKLQSIEINCNQLQANASKCSRNPIQSESESNPNPKPAARGIEQNEKFSRFWAVYPRHEAKQTAQKAFTKLDPDETLLQTMIQAVERQKASPQWQENGGQFIPYPATWLNGRRWEDQVQGGTQAKKVTAQQYPQREQDILQETPEEMLDRLFSGGRCG